MLTHALTTALNQAAADDLDVTWSTIINRVRQRVLTLMPVQRPEAEGPAQRLLFDIAEADPLATLPVEVSGEQVRLDGAALLGVRPGDEFVIMPGDSPGPDNDRKVADVRVNVVDVDAAWGTLRLRSPELTVPMGARAHCVRTAAPAMPVRVATADPRLADVIRAVGAVALLRVAEPTEECPVAVEVDDAGHLTVRDGIGPLHPPRSADATGIAQVMRDLKRLARASAFRCLTEEPEHALSTPITVEFGRVENGQAQPLSTSGAVLYVDQRVYVRVRNGGPARVYVSLLDIGVAAQISLLNTSSPGGVGLDPDAEYVFGANELTGTLPGVALSWPGDLIRAEPRPESIVAIVTSEPMDVRVLEQQGIRRAGRRTGSKLEWFVAQLSTGESRDVAPESRPTVRFAVRTIDFDLVPVPAPPTEVARFQVDQRPAPGTLLWSPRGVAPAAVALRLTDLVVHHNRAFRTADIRLDTVVITCDRHRRPVYHAHTERFHNISDGQRLPLDNMLVYHGPAVDYVDLAVWISRDSKDSLALSDLLRDTLTDADMQAALGQVSGLLIAAPQAAAAVAAIGAGAVIVNAAYRLLRLTFGDSVGLYRTTLLAREQFGVGRPAEQSTVRAQDFSFRYVVDEVDLVCGPRGPSVAQ